MTGSEWFSSAPGGLNRYFTDLFLALARHPEASVSAAAFGDAPPAPGAKSWGPVGRSTARRTRTAFRARSDLRPGTVLDRHFCLYGPAAVDRRGGMPLVVHFHGPWAAESRLTGQREFATRAKYLVERLRYLRADRFVVLSPYFRDVLSNDYRVPADRIEVIPPGVDLTRFTAAPVPNDSDVRTILCVRRLERRMGIDNLLRCWPEVLAAHRDARLVIVGTGTAESELRSQAAPLGESVRFAGHIGDDELTALYAAAELTVVPTIALEGFGLIALESLAAGRAPIVTDCGGLPDSVRGLDPSLIVPAGDAEALGSRIVSALNGDLPESAKCRAHAESFSWDVTAERHLTMYRDIRRIKHREATS
ncbi:glycosyltransferase family 4 protein [Nocardia goodfellowii]|uniref:Glycosyltransferase involved in cell wall biosynthesis n=1 Tax=Nocardia goodfellowii TaxID=882446 RepID=A0ABS4QLQ3_9NOCA|nr:glycosyltransferase family 4 protein [Nocardia goodfellowii]MBP2192632.1 glycosyltransferase involved in cell wall biosynthesis [Nocardia goodfellowii]